MKITSSTFKAVQNLLRFKPAKYANRQLSDVLKFGRTRQYPNVNEEILEKYTPFRRLSKKKCTLSDSSYFIQRFEQESPLEIPKMWEKMSEADKVDFIVKNRYERILSNKIMTDIQSSKVEQSFILSTDGKIKYYDTVNSSKICYIDNRLLKDSVHIHNHPIQFINKEGCWEYSDLAQVNANSRPFSEPDIIEAIRSRAKKAYVVDAKSIKFQFIPRQGNSAFETRCLKEDLIYIFNRAFDGTRPVEEAFRKNYIDFIKRIKQDGHNFKILNFWEFDRF